MQSKSIAFESVALDASPQFVVDGSNGVSSSHAEAECVRSVGESGESRIGTAFENVQRGEGYGGGGEESVGEEEAGGTGSYYGYFEGGVRVDGGRRWRGGE